jgi:hypothetical protein
MIPIAVSIALAALSLASALTTFGNSVPDVVAMANLLVKELNELFQKTPCFLGPRRFYDETPATQNKTPPLARWGFEECI